MEKIIRKSWYVIYLLLLGRNIQLLSNGYSNKLTGIWLLLNMVFCLIFSYVIAKNNYKYNRYVIGFILTFTLFLINYSGYRDLNKMFNITVIILLIISIIAQALIINIEIFKKKKYEKIIFLILNFCCGLYFIYFLNCYYQEPKTIKYSTDVINIKNERELEKTIGKLPMINSMEISNRKDFEDIDYYQDFYGVNEVKENTDEIFEVYVKYSVNNESLDLLAEKIRNYVKLLGKENKKIKLYMLDIFNHYEPIRVYSIKDDNMKVIYTRENIQVNNSFLDIFVIFTKMLKGQNLATMMGEGY